MPESQAPGTGTQGYDPSLSTTEAGYAPSAYERRYEEEGRRAAVVGFTALGGTLMVLGGIWSLFVGSAGLASRTVALYGAVPTNYVYHWNSTGWSWVWLVAGILLVAVGVSVFLGMAWARYVGSGIAVLDAVAWFLFIPFAPLLAILAIAMNAFIIWALLVPRRAEERI